jgi:hydrogenase maturation protease
MSGERMDVFLGAARRSPHEVGLLDLFDIARLTESLPENRALIGIQPKSIEWGMSPTPPVEKALPIAVEQAENLLEQWEIASGKGSSCNQKTAKQQVQGLPSWVNP